MTPTNTDCTAGHEFDLVAEFARLFRNRQGAESRMDWVDAKEALDIFLEKNSEAITKHNDQ